MIGKKKGEFVIKQTQGWIFTYVAKKKCTLQYVILKCKYVVFIYVAKFKQSS